MTREYPKDNYIDPPETCEWLWIGHLCGIEDFEQMCSECPNRKRCHPLPNPLFPTPCKLEEKLIALLETHEYLFEEVDMEELDPEDIQDFFADGEAGILEVGEKTYRFIYDEVSGFIGDEIYHW